MSRGELAIAVRGLSKSYTIAHNTNQHVTMIEAALAKVRHPFNRPTKETFRALHDVNFEINKGEVVGVVGRNGAGKSTLLKVLSRITEPTTGQIDLYGRIGSLLEVGTGFHPELTGRENVFLNGAILGMTKKEIRKQFDAIVDFAGVEKFLDTPVKRYSSGMYVRLAFAVAAHLNPEILIVDEVLAVGDLNFQKKCIGKMGEVSRSGRSVLFVSHNMAAVQQLCTRGILLKSGTVFSDGPINQVVQEYLKQLSERSAVPISARDDRRGSGTARILDLAINGQGSGVADCQVTAGEPAIFDCTIDRPVTGMNMVIAIYDRNGQRIYDFNSSDISPEDIRTELPVTSIKCAIPELMLVPGEYIANVALFDSALVDHIEGALTLVVENGVLRGRPIKDGTRGVGVMPHQWSFAEAGRN
jgi:lipopolysaccharide transport system ATP-binding protein